MAEVLVTGATGLAGRSLISGLRRQGHAVRALARTPEGASALEQAGFEVHVGDVRDRASLERACVGIESVVHAAATVAFGARLSRLREVNVAGTSNVLAAARNAGVGRFVHVGAAATALGGKPVVDADDSWPYPPGAVGPYTRTKREAEELVRAANGPGFRTTVLRPALLWGPGARFVVETARVCRSRRFAWIDGGRYPFSVCHVDNLAAAAAAALERGSGGQSYFVADSERTSFREFNTVWLRALGLEPPTRIAPGWILRIVVTLVELVSYPFVGRSQPPLSREMVALIGQALDVSSARAHEELGYEPVVSRDEAVAELRAWYLSREAAASP